MEVKPSFNHYGETNLQFMEKIVGQEVSVRTALTVHGHVRVLTGDRLAVTSALLLGSSIVGSLKVGRPISARVATALRRFLGDDGLDMPEVTDVPLAVHSGSIEMIVSLSSDDDLQPLSHTDRRRIRFQELPTHTSSGRLFTFEKVTVATNSWLYSQLADDQSGRQLESCLAVPVLMAQELSASKITVPQHLVEERRAEEITRVAHLLASTDIVLSVDGKVIHAY